MLYSYLAKFRLFFGASCQSTLQTVNWNGLFAGDA